MTNYSVTHYATNVHGQPNANAADAQYRVGWANIPNASAKTCTTKPQGNTTSHYYKDNKHRKPVTFSAHDFDFELPSCAYVNKITFRVYIKATKSINVKAPYARFNIYGGQSYVDFMPRDPDNPTEEEKAKLARNVDTYREDDTGWDGGVWYYNPNKKLSNTWQSIEYVLTGAEFNKREYPISSINSLRFGIDLRWYNSEKLANSTIGIAYVSCTVDYELANPVITFDTVTSERNPRYVTAGSEYTVKAYFSNKSNAGCCNGDSRDIHVQLPHNAQLTYSSGNFNYETNVWTVPCTANASSTLELHLKDFTIGEDRINFYNSDLGNWEYWIYSALPEHDVGIIRAFPQDVQKGVVSCIVYSTTVLSTDETVVFDVNVDTANDTNPDLDWSIDYDATMSDVTIESYTNNSLTLNVPAGEERRIVFKSCFIPDFDSNSAVSVTIRDTVPVVAHIAPYELISAPQFIVRNKPIYNESYKPVSEIALNPEVIRYTMHRVASDTELGAYVIDCGVADYDGKMVLDDCTLTAHTWGKLDYIGMVPLEYHHYDPKSTYENKAISESYKNKNYKGKEGIIDENISLKFKVRPYQATILQGLVKLDKPTPINANHKCFEGDVLNHRGWVVLSKVEVERTNPLWYDVDATVDYITHDINTKFQIFKGNAINNIAMPDMQADIFELGENLSTGLDVFKIDTDGGFVYDEDGEDGAKNIFSLDNGQHLLISTLNPLTDVSKIRFDWYSNRINEYRENNLRRIFRLKDSNGNSIFEYEYCDFKFVDEYVTCTVIIRVKNEDGGWNEPITLIDVDLKTELEADPIVDDDDDEEFTDVVFDEEELVVEETTTDDDDEIDDDAYQEGYIAPTFNPEDYDISLVYGSSLELSLNGRTLNILDSGYNGSEVEPDAITLIDSDYTFETYWVNNNEDGTTEDIISYIDISLSQTILNTQYSSLYSNTIVSPFPVPHKRVVFTRESEEGTIYYMNDEEPFKYRLEPFYQYHCGTDLTTHDGISIFDLNNSYTRFYIDNGLVRLGFNKYNARLTLAKWDIVAKQWITTHHFQMSVDTKFSVESYSDDKITIKAGSNTLFTIYRGHPYIVIKQADNIRILSDFNYAYGDLVDNRKYEYPVISSFLNTNNLLPSCIGGTSIDLDCITIDDDIIAPGTNHTVTLNLPETITALADSTLGVTISPATSDGEIHYLVNGDDIGSADSPFTFDYQFPQVGTYTVQAVYTGDEDDNVAISDEVTVIVQAPEPGLDTKAETGTPDVPTGKYELIMVHAPSSFTYKDYVLNQNQQVILQLLRGGAVCPGMIVEVQRPNGHTVSVFTDGEGKVYIPNDRTDYVPGKWQWGGRFYDDWDDNGNITGNIIYESLKWITIDKATPTFSHNATTGIVSKGNSWVVKLNGVDRQAGTTNIGLDDKKITYTINGGSKKTKTTNAKGNIHIPCNTIGTYKIKLKFAGSTRYNAITKTFTIKVV